MLNMAAEEPSSDQQKPSSLERTAIVSIEDQLDRKFLRFLMEIEKRIALTGSQPILKHDKIRIE